MQQNLKDNILIWVTLLILMVTAFVTRVENFKQTTWRSVDETVYQYLALSFRHDLTTYNTQGLTDILEETQPQLFPLKEYLHKPLFKHPPLFPLLLSIPFKMVGNVEVAGIYLPCLMGILMIPLTYLMGKLFFDDCIGMMAAFFIWLDPISIICSQKVWMDTTLAFFMVLSIYFYVFGMKHNRENFYILGGLMGGLAVLSKYPGILSWIAILVYVMIHDKSLLKSIKFRISLLIPFIMLIPWLIWNIKVYGKSVLLDQALTHEVITADNQAYVIWILICCAIIVIVTRAFLISKHNRPLKFEREDEQEDDEQDSASSPVKRIIVIVYGLLFIVALHKHISRSFAFTFFPYTSWQGAQFEQPLFYFRRLIEFSLIYLSALLSFFVPDEERQQNAIMLHIASGVILLFFLIWGNNQSRYILASIPFLIILGVRFFAEMYGKLGLILKGWPKNLARLLLIILAVYVYIKTNYINFLISHPNDMCYF